VGLCPFCGYGLIVCLYLSSWIEVGLFWLLLLEGSAFL